MALSFNTTQNNPATDSSDCIVIGAFSDKTFNAAGQQLDAASNGRLAALAARGDISGKIGTDRAAAGHRRASPRRACW